MLQDALGAEHLPVLHTVELHLFGGVLSAVLNLRLGHLTCAQRWIGCRGHGQSGQHLIIHWQVVRCNLMRALVIRTLDHAVLGKFAYAFAAERVATGQRYGFLIVMVVGLKANAALEN